MTSVTDVKDAAFRQSLLDGTLDEFRARVAPYRDDAAARREIQQFLYNAPKTNLNWQKNEALRLHKELPTGEITVDRVLAAEVERLRERMATGDLKSLKDVPFEFAEGALENLRKSATGKLTGRDVKKLFNSSVVSRLQSYAGAHGHIDRMRRQFPDLRLVVQLYKGEVTVNAVSDTEERKKAEAKQALQEQGAQFAAIEDLQEFIDAVAATAHDSKLRTAIKAELRARGDVSLLSWQKQEALAVFGKGQVPEANQLTAPQRMKAAIEDSQTHMTSQFNAAVQEMTVVAGAPAVSALATLATTPGPEGRFLSGPALVNDLFATPVIKWMSQHWQEAAAYVKAYPDAQLLVETLPERGQLASPVFYSPGADFNQWKSHPAVGKLLTAPGTARFQRKPVPSS
ncbi:MAG TPA: hypothetical protein VEF76_05135 [Patescibacteria group bacterium]|nr:hypothetical protein [Patescibacteria group bacterium]